ncbi:uncharacterized protein KGF55_002556 [Candida pseudojiufengensis]|uniref:uncharacterized protein n=1 Tax=Candida pseudojiufengensis TaxID=497109 RepID=UPI002224DE93|nr:uncharacterized protein KGF55_002556 [Candida pseudojiufengensis]KAI5963676.1 hypothetical protein KGF55_002556 [Candida pseudojiufengensis]
MCGKKDNCCASESQSHSDSQKNNFPFPNDEIDKYVESFDKVLSNIGSITNAIVDVSMDAGRELNDKAKQWSSNWLFNNHSKDDDFENFVNEKSNDSKTYEFPSFYQTRDSAFNGDWESGSPFKEFFKNSPFFQNAHLKFGATPFGYRSYKGPSIRQYHDCLDKHGKSIWDDQGYWRCLFPESTIPIDLLKFKNEYFKDQIITKEDFMNQMHQLGESEKNPIVDLQKNGKFFNKYEDYLSWKKDQYSEYKKKKEEEAKTRAEARAKYLQDLKEKQNTQAKSGGEKHDSIVSKFITSSSIKSNMFTDSETNEIKLVEDKKECYNDGDCIFTKITRSKPIGARDWVNVEERVENSNSTNLLTNNENTSSNATDNKGWFWK